MPRIRTKRDDLLSRGLATVVRQNGRDCKRLRLEWKPDNPRTGESELVRIIVILKGATHDVEIRISAAQQRFEAAAPPLYAEVSAPVEVPARTGKVCYVVYVAEAI